VYRRGQAYAGLKQLNAASRDLIKALRLCSNDPTQAKPIREKLQDVKDQISSIRAAGGVIAEPISQASECVLFTGFTRLTETGSLIRVTVTGIFQISWEPPTFRSDIIANGVAPNGALSGPSLGPSHFGLFLADFGIWYAYQMI
jgi:hypothetical protein